MEGTFYEMVWDGMIGGKEYVQYIQYHIIYSDPWSPSGDFYRPNLVVVVVVELMTSVTQIPIRHMNEVPLPRGFRLYLEL